MNTINNDFVVVTNNEIDKYRLILNDIFEMENNDDKTTQAIATLANLEHNIKTIQQDYKEFSYNQNIVIKIIKMYLNVCDNISGKDNKVIICDEIFSYISRNNEILGAGRFGNAVKDKLEELYSEPLFKDKSEFHHQNLFGEKIEL